MFKVVYNNCFGGFGLSNKAKERYKELSGGDEIDEYICDRHDPILVKVVEELGSKMASGQHAKLQIEEIDCRTYRIKEYDGNESVETPENDHLSWTVIG